MGKRVAKIPQIGWNQVLQQKEDFLFNKVADEMHLSLCIHIICFQKRVGMFLDLAVTYMILLQLSAKKIYGEFSFIQKKSQNSGLQRLKNFVLSQ